MPLIVNILIVALASIISLEIIRGIIKMDYKLALRNLMSMVEIVFFCIFTVTHLLGSLILLISTLCMRELGHTDSHHTVDISMFGYNYTLTTKK